MLQRKLYDYPTQMERNKCRQFINQTQGRIVQKLKFNINSSGTSSGNTLIKVASDTKLAEITRGLKLNSATLKLHSKATYFKINIKNFRHEFIS